MSKREQLPNLMNEALGNVKILPEGNRGQVIKIRKKNVRKLESSSVNNDVLLTKFKKLRLTGMVEAFESQYTSGFATLGSFESRLDQLLDWEIKEREIRRNRTRLKASSLRYNAKIEEIDLSFKRGLNKALIDNLASLSWLNRRQNIIITGPIGTGKTYLACALAYQVCRNGKHALYRTIDQAITDLSCSDAKILQKYQKLYAKADLVVLDEFGLRILNETEQLTLFKLLDDRYDNKSVIMISRNDPDKWPDYFMGQEFTEAIFDRLTANNKFVKLAGPSLRKYYSGNNI